MNIHLNNYHIHPLYCSFLSPIFYNFNKFHYSIFIHKCMCLAAFQGIIQTFAYELKVILPYAHGYLLYLPSPLS
jgi:hypothetical protein